VGQGSSPVAKLTPHALLKSSWQASCSRKIPKQQLYQGPFYLVYVSRYFCKRVIKRVVHVTHCMRGYELVLAKHQNLDKEP